VASLTAQAPTHPSASRYRASHLLLPPSLLSLSRVGFAVCFPFAVGSPAAALSVLALAALSDVLDGWVARRYGMVTATGALLDGLTDKVFVFAVVLTLLVEQRLSLIALALLGVRELGELPLLVWLALLHARHSAGTERPKANLLGKAATVMQFVTVGAVLSGSTRIGAWLAGTAARGLLAAVSYWRRWLSYRP
jgi:phosphatidylglycerophosphate synthase